MGSRQNQAASTLSTFQQFLVLVRRGERGGGCVSRFVSVLLYTVYVYSRCIFLLFFRTRLVVFRGKRIVARGARRGGLSRIWVRTARLFVVVVVDGLHHTEVCPAVVSCFLRLLVCVGWNGMLIINDDDVKHRYRLLFLDVISVLILITLAIPGIVF